eukprot:6198046-Pleurochrysis_carterae.AAC.2
MDQGSMRAEACCLQGRHLCQGQCICAQFKLARQIQGRLPYERLVLQLPFALGPYAKPSRSQSACDQVRHRYPERQEAAGFVRAQTPGQQEGAPAVGKQCMKLPSGTAFSGARAVSQPSARAAA